LNKTPTRQYTPEERERAKAILRRAKGDRVWALKNLVYIKDETGKAVPFNLYAHQEEIIQLKHDPTVRTLVIGKYRKAGVSVALMADAVLDARFTRNRQTMILNKDDNDTATMFDHVHFVDAHLPVELQGQKDKAGEKAIKYTDTGGLIRTGTAGNSEGTSSKKGRGTDTHVLHCTEFRFYNYLSSIVQGATNSIPEGGKLIYESTSNGPMGEGAALIQHIRRHGKEIRKGELWRMDDQVFLFLSALKHPKCRRPVPLGFALNALDEDEYKEEARILRIGEEKGLPIDEVESFLAFRRWKISGFVQQEEGGGGAKLSPAAQFKREFPVTFEDGEEAAGRNYFNTGIIQAERAYVEALNPYRLVKSITRQPGGKTILGAPTEDNKFIITAAPELGYKNRYVVFADCGQGNAASDPDCIKCLDRLKMEVVATAHGRLGATKGVDRMLALAEFYDNAWIAWDMTGIGAEWRPLVLASLYPRIWTRREVESPFMEPDAVGLVWGYESKLGACSMLRSKLEHKGYKDYDLAFFDECQQFGFDEKGNGPQAANGFTDDRVTTNAGLCWVSANLPGVVEAEVRPKPFQDQTKLEQRVREIRLAAARPEAKGNGNWD
jgi:hypothetical protein